jgi:1A family penicillin-binding protein
MPLRYTKSKKRRSSRKSYSGRAGFFSVSNLKPSEIKKWFKYLFTTKEGLKKIGTVALIGFGFLVFLFGWFAKDLPTPNKINSRFAAQTTQIFDRNGKILYEMHGDKNRILVEFNEIPDNIKNATVAIEDKNFYKHQGFSGTRIIGSALTNVLSGRRAAGGSTITQQFVKNAILSPEKTYTRKVKELILSIEIEQMYKKDDILKMYLNEIPYGSNAYGVKVAAKTYFDKDLKDITLEEAAVLAALPQAPTYYSPFGENKDDLLARKDLVLSLMADQGFITNKQAEAAKKKEIAFSNNPYGSITAPHFVMYVKQKLVEKYGEQMSSEGGLKVYTSLDLEKQKAAEDAISAGEAKFTRYGATNASLVSVDPKTGQIIAMVGSKDFFNQEIDGNVNVATQNRQPGSSFKPFAYATSWKQPNWGPGSTMYDFKTDFGGGYVPSNYNGRDHGIQSMRSSLSGSLNIPAVKALYIAGLDDTLKTAHEMGITTLNDSADYGLSLVLGSGEVKPVDMASAYGVFANNGIRQDLNWFVKIEDSKGKTLDEFKPRSGKQVLDPQIAYLMSDVLSDNNARSYVFGSRNPLTLPDRKVAAKTGTTNDFKDAWTVGYTPNIATAVWVGNNDGTKMKKGADGSVIAAPIWQSYMKAATKNLPKEEFKKPSGIKTVTIDAITGRKATTATKQTRTDLFPSWYKTPAVNGQAVEVKVDKLSGKLATDKCPPELIETRIFSPITAEIPPNDPSFARWNAPVQAWANANGYSTSLGSVPTEPCDLHTGEDLPMLDIISPDEKQNVSNIFTVKMQVATPAGFNSLTVSVDGKNYLATAKGSYYEANVQASGGLQKITATLKDKKMQTTTQSVTVNVSAGIESSKKDDNPKAAPISEDETPTLPRKQPIKN